MTLTASLCAVKAAKIPHAGRSCVFCPPTMSKKSSPQKMCAVVQTKEKSRGEGREHCCLPPAPLVPVWWLCCVATVLSPPHSFPLCVFLLPKRPVGIRKRRRKKAEMFIAPLSLPSPSDPAGGSKGDSQEKVKETKDT